MLSANLSAQHPQLLSGTFQNAQVISLTSPVYLQPTLPEQKRLMKYGSVSHILSAPGLLTLLLEHAFINANGFLSALIQGYATRR